MNLVRALAGHEALPLGRTPGETILRDHLQKLRNGIGQARSTPGLREVTWTDPTVTAGVTPVKAIHLVQLRAATQ